MQDSTVQTNLKNFSKTNIEDSTNMVGSFFDGLYEDNLKHYVLLSAG